MKLTFHDRTTEPAQRHLALLTVEPSGRFYLNPTTTKALALKVGSPALLVSNEANEWFLVCQPVEGRQHFELVARTSGGALAFNSLAVAQAFYKAHNLTGKEAPSAKLTIDLKPVKHEGLKLYPIASRPLPGKPAASRPTKDAARPDEAALARLNRTILALGGVQLHKRDENELTGALGALEKHEGYLPQLKGGEQLLAKLRAHFGHKQNA